MNNRLAKKQIINVEIFRRNGCLPAQYRFTFKDNDFGYWVKLKSGWFFRAVYFGTISLTATQLKQQTDNSIHQA